MQRNSCKYKTLTPLAIFNSPRHLLSLPSSSNFVFSFPPTKCACHPLSTAPTIMASPSKIHWCKFMFVSCMLIISMAGLAESSLVFRVGGPRGWIVPASNETGIYNDWAIKERFHIGDSLYFKYSNDSVLVVDRVDYDDCNTTNPVDKYEDGETTFKFDHFGFFYFISGNSKHCKSGQKLIIQVMGQSEIMITPTMAPSPSAEGPGEQGGGPSVSPSSSIQMTTGVAYLVATLVGLTALRMIV